MHKALFNLPVLTTALLSIAATAAISWAFIVKPEPPSLMLDQPMAVPDFAVTDQNGNTLTRESMLGQVWVCDFFLTECTFICPKLGQTMADLSAKLSADPAFKDVKLVSFSVNPDHDTTEVIQQYRAMYLPAWTNGDAERKADLESRWLHVRSQTNDEIWQIANDGFKLYTGPSEGDPTTPVAHASKLVLIDRAGQIRGYYDGLTDLEMPALLADVRRVVASKN